MATIQDLIQNSLEEKPADMKNDLHDLMMSRIHDKLQEKKAEVAARFFDAADEDEEEELEDDEEDLDDDEESDEDDDSDEEFEDDDEFDDEESDEDEEV